MEISVVITTFNNGDLLPEVIEPLLADPAATEIVVVVDGSRDGSYEKLVERAERDQRLRPFFIENRGRPAAREYALAQAAHELLLLVDADVVPEPGLVSGHAAWHEDGTPRLVIGYMPISAERRATSFVADYYARDYEDRCNHYEQEPERILRGLWMGNMSLPRRYLDEVGGFDSGMGLRYNSDLELGLRLAETDLEAVFDRRLGSEHCFERSITGFVRTARDSGRGMVLIAAKHDGVWLPAPPRSRLDAAMRDVVMRPAVFKPLRATGLWLLSVAERLHLRRIEWKVGVKLERLEIEKGMREARAIIASRGQCVPVQVGSR